MCLPGHAFFDRHLDHAPIGAGKVCAALVRLQGQRGTTSPHLPTEPAAAAAPPPPVCLCLISLPHPGSVRCCTLLEPPTLQRRVRTICAHSCPHCGFATKPPHLRPLLGAHRRAAMLGPISDIGRQGGVHPIGSPRAGRASSSSRRGKAAPPPRPKPPASSRCRGRPPCQHRRPRRWRQRNPAWS